MNTKIIHAFRIPSLLLAAVLQFMPMVRAALPAMQSASNLFAIIFRWGGAAAVALGSVQAVSGASTVITLGNVTATNGVAITNKLLTSPQTAGWWSVSGAPPGIGLIGSGSSSKLGGVPTAVGVYSVSLVAKSSASAGASETTSKTIVYTVIANTGGGGGGASNSPPVATAQSVSTAEDTAKAITLTGSDPDGNALTYSVVAPPAHGTLSGTAPSVTYTPSANYNGADSFTFRVNDGTNNSTAATVSITVTAVNDAPVASAQSVSTPEDTAKAITLAGTDVDGNTLTYTVVASPAHGTLTGTGASRTYTPAANFNGADSFTFKVNDGTVDSATATVSITVTAVNDAPVATAQSVATDKNVAKSVTLAGTDVDGNALTFTVVAQPTKGVLSGTAPNLTYTPNNNVTGSDSFTFKANDGAVDSAAATVAITIAAGPNTAPVANAQSVAATEDTAAPITLTGTDADGNALAYAVVTSPAHGTLSGTAPNVTYTPTANYNGADSFTFRVNDGISNSTPATVSITVAAVNDAPLASAQSVSTPEDTAKAITLTGTDADGNTLTYTVVASPAHGALSGSAPNLTYTPAANYNGADSFSFKVNDGTVDSATATVSITVAAVNDAPVASAQSVTTAEDTAKTITLAGSDVDGNALTYAVVASPTHGTLSGTAPNVTYTPAANYNGSDSFTFKVNDGTVDSATATVSITVTAVNDAPVATAQSVATDKNVAKAITLAGTDVDGNALTFAIVTQPTKGALSGTAPNLTYTPNSNVTGADSFTFKANDGTVDSAAATVSVNIAAGSNTPPVATAQSVTAAEDTAKAITLSGTDADGNALTYAIVASPAQGTLTGTGANRTYTPAANYNGADSFTFKANDGTVDSATATVSITVTAVNDAPVATAQSVATDKNVAKAITLAGTDVDGNALTFAVVTPPTKGVLSGTGPNLTYTPNNNVTGADSFTFKANDGTVDSAAATVAITIASGPNTAPVATAQSVTVNEDATMLITLAGTDADGNTLAYAVVTAPAHGTLSGTAPALYYRPATNYNGSDTLWFKVNDGTVDSAAAVVSITVTPVNDAPVANAQNISTAQDTAKAVTLSSSDVDGDALTFTVTTAPAHGTLSGTAPNLTYTPGAGYNGSDTIWFKANDGTADSALAVVSLTVNAVATPATNLSIVSVIAGANAAEPNKVGSFLFTRAGNATKALTLFFTLDGTAVPGTDYSNPGNKVTFAAGRTNATLLIKPIADRIFEGAKTVVLTLVDSTNFDAGAQDSASILIGDDDRPRITISAPRPATDDEDEDEASPRIALRPTAIVQTKVHAAAYAGFNLLLQCSTDLTNWTVVAAPPLEQPIDYVNPAPADTKTCCYRVIYVRDAVTEASIAEALAHQMFSANLVGVVNVSLQPGWNLAANPLNGMPQDGPLGDLPDGTVFVPFKSSKANTYEEGKWSRGVPLTRSTTGGWIYNPSDAPVTITYVGEVPNPASQPQLPAGWNVRSSVVDTTVGNDTLLGYPLHIGDALYEFNPLGSGPDMWITHLRGAGGWDNPPALTAGQGVLIYKAKATRPNAVVPAPPTPNQIRFIPVNHD